MAGMACHTAQTQEAVAPEKLPPPEKLSGIGNVHLEITASPEAQAWFNQGLNLLHDFWDYESVRAFEQGARVDPQCAMCYWGIYQAETFRHSNSWHFAKEALAKAVSLKGRVSKAERLYIEAIAAEQAAKESDEDDKKAAKKGEVEIYRKLVKSYPRDTQARIFLSQALEDGYEDDGTAREGQKEAIAILQSVLKDEPENSAANHYWIHAVEASPHPEQALHSAEILGGLAPASGHMVHMPGHIFYRTGDYARAEQSFAASTRADEQYMSAQHVEADDDWNYVHNLMYAIANLLEAGKLNEAIALSAKLRNARGKLESTLYVWSTRDAITRLDPRLPVALRSGDWPVALGLLAQSNPPESQPNLRFLARQLVTFAHGMQAVEGGELVRAEEASSQLDAELWRASQRIKAAEDAHDNEKNKKAAANPAPRVPVMPDAQAQPLVDNVSIMSLELRAALLVARGKNADAKQLYAQAAKQEKALGYHEPPAYIRPVGEAEAAAFLAASNWNEAKQAFEAALKDRPRSGFPLYGMAQASERAGDSKAAAAGYAQFLAAWKSADTDLPQMAHARSFIASHNSAAGSK